MTDRETKMIASIKRKKSRVDDTSEGGKESEREEGREGGREGGREMGITFRCQ